MSYILEEQLAAAENYGGKRTAGDIQYLVIHYTGNDGDSAAGNAAYFRNNIVRVSAHYFVDDTTVYRSVPDLRIAWAVGGAKYANAHLTGGGSMYGILTNANSLSVELCDTRRDGVLQATEATLENAAALCRKLMAEYAIPVENVYRHFDVTGKRCPGYFIDPVRWAEFKTRLEEDSMTQKQFDSMLENWLSRRSALLPSDSSAAARQWAEEAGIIGGFADGSKQYKAFCTREQLALMLHRLWLRLAEKNTL